MAMASGAGRQGAVQAAAPNPPNCLLHHLLLVSPPSPLYCCLRNHLPSLLPRPPPRLQAASSTTLLLTTPSVRPLICCCACRAHTSCRDRPPPVGHINHLLLRTPPVVAASWRPKPPCPLPIVVYTPAGSGCLLRPTTTSLWCLPRPLLLPTCTARPSWCAPRLSFLLLRLVLYPAPDLLAASTTPLRLPRPPPILLPCLPSQASLLPRPLAPTPAAA